MATLLLHHILQNIITGNLGANSRPSFAMLTTDATPATLTNPDNYVERNVAAGKSDESATYS